MSDQDDTQQQPAEQPNLGPGRPTKAKLDAKAAALAQREKELEARERAIAEANAESRAYNETLGPGARRSTDEVRQVKDGENPKSIRRPMGQHKRMDVDKYVEMYKDKKLMLINDINGDVQRWIDEGAEPVPVRSKGDRAFEGITDKHDSKWVRFIGGDDGFGNHFYVYLLMIAPELYDEIKIAPQRERQALIKRAMRAGHDQSETVSGLRSYAPNLPDGNVGYSESHSQVVGPR